MNNLSVFQTIDCYKAIKQFLYCKYRNIEKHFYLVVCAINGNWWTKIKTIDYDNQIISQYGGRDFLRQFYKKKDLMLNKEDMIEIVSHFHGSLNLNIFRELMKSGVIISVTEERQNAIFNLKGIVDGTTILSTTYVNEKLKDFIIEDLQNEVNRLKEKPS